MASADFRVKNHENAVNILELFRIIEYDKGNKNQTERRGQMHNLKDFYLLFFSGGLSYLLPLSWVKQVTGRREETDDIPVVDLSDSQLSGMGQEYLILLEKEGRQLAILAEEVPGLRNVRQEQLHRLKAPVINEKNRYLEAVTKLEENKNLLTYVLNPEFLSGDDCGRLG